MSSWATVKDSEQWGGTDDEHQDVEPAGELGIFKLRSTYTRALSALHRSENAYDTDWCESRAHFEEIVSLAERIMDETAAARSECTLLQFVAYSNLSRMLSKTDEKKSALNHALDAAAVFSIRYSSVHDPGLLLRIARLTLDVGDLWSCEQILIRGINGNATYGSGVDCLLDSFYQLHFILQRRIASLPLLESAADSCNECEVISLQGCASSPSSSIHNSLFVFNKVAASLASKNCLETTDYSFTLHRSVLNEALDNDMRSPDLPVSDVATGDIPSALKLPLDKQGIREGLSLSRVQNYTSQSSALPSSTVTVLEGSSSVTAAATATTRKQTTETRETRSNPSQDQKSQSDNIGATSTRRKKENQNVLTLAASRLPALKVKIHYRMCVRYSALHTDSFQVMILSFVIVKTVSVFIRDNFLFLILHHNQTFSCIAEVIQIITFSHLNLLDPWLLSR
jgi:hypothetical protein